MKTFRLIIVRELALVGLVGLVSGCQKERNATPESVPVIAVTDSIAPADDHQLLFGEVASGFDATGTVTVANAGDAALVLGAVASAHPLAAPFTITGDTCSGQTLAPAGTCAISVRFAPGAGGAVSAVFDIPSNDPATSSLTFSVHGTGLASQTYPAPVATTGQTACFSASGTEVACAASGQDGELRAGVTWPTPRFVRGAGAESECITDGLTGLVWSRDGHLVAAAKTLQDALDWVAALNAGAGLCGSHDWRLPNKNELRSLASYGEVNVSTWLNAAAQGFVNVQSGPYWSSTTGTLAGDLASAWTVNMMDGYLLLADKDGTMGGHYVWPVRAGSANAPAPVARTGQTLCYTTAGAAIACAGTGQDGDLQQGVAWPVSRFTVDADTSLTDGLTGLTWGPDASAPTFSTCTGGAMHWQDALSWIACLNANGYLGHTDWRLPNVNELQSLANAGDTLGLWLGNQGFVGTMVPPGVLVMHWTSDSRAATPSLAWAIHISGGMPVASKTTASYRAWPVRGP